ncbi:MAG: hypothetical protein HYX41_06010 [Bdellovibrio sp.]|nr:hypothetical protein [Bdellovibrio sp.]
MLISSLPSKTKLESSQKVQHRSARITFDSGNPQPSDLWFQFVSTDPELLASDHLDPFAVSLLLVGMKRKEAIRINGSLSRSVYEGMKKYQEIYHEWFPDQFHLIEILPDSLREEPSYQSKHESLESLGSAAAFSGGVDSFYSFLKLAHGTESPKLTHTLFMAGFDMPLNLKDSIHQLTSTYSKLMTDSGISFVTGSTNIRKFVNSVEWTNAHGQALIASALFFESHWQSFTIPSSYTHGSYPKWGTHPSLDPLLSTSTMKFKHHGAEKNRVSKLEWIAQHPESFHKVRVCWIQELGLQNCGVCEKCIRTQLALQILDKNDNYLNFERKLTRKAIRSLSQRTYQGRLFAWELIKEALSRWKFGVAFDLWYSLIARRIRYTLKRLSN